MGSFAITQNAIFAQLLYSLFCYMKCLFCYFGSSAMEMGFLAWLKCYHLAHMLWPNSYAIKCSFTMKIKTRMGTIFQSPERRVIGSEGPQYDNMVSE